MKRFTVLVTLLLCACFLITACQKSNEDTNNMSNEEITALIERIAKAERSTTAESRLQKYYEIIEQYPNNIEARLNIVKCYIELGNYQMAAQALDFIVTLDPTNTQIYESYIRLSKYSGDLSYAYTAIDLAKQNHCDAFLAMRPEVPKIKTEGGEYTSHLNFEVDTNGIIGDIYVTVENDGALSYDFTKKYTGPIPLLSGNNTVSVFTVADGMPSETLTATYSISYEPTELTFHEPNIEKLVRIVLNKPSGAITDVDCESIDQLNWSELRNSVSTDSAYKSMKIHSLEDLRYFPRLSKLELHYQTEITDYSPLASCQFITTLNLIDSYLEHISFVDFTPQLEHLSLYNSERKWVYLDNIDALAKLNTLKSLNIQHVNLGVQIDNRSWRVHHLDDVILSNPGITSLNIETDQIMNDYLLTELKLTHLNTWGIRSINFPALSKLSTLESLYIWHTSYEYWQETSLQSLSFLKDLTNLKKLGLGGLDKVNNLEYIKHLENLDYLKLAEDSDVTSNASAMAELQAALPNCQIVTE